MRKNSGFTAFELAVSMSIMVVIAALVLPPYLQWLRGHRIRGAVTNLMGDLEMAKIMMEQYSRYSTPELWQRIEELHGGPIKPAVFLK